MSDGPETERLPASEIAVAVVDTCGRLIGKRLAARRLAEAIDPGMPMPNFHLVTGITNVPFTTLAVTGPATGFRNGRLRVDPATRFRVPGEPTTDYYLTDALTLDGRPVAEAPRSILRRQCEHLAAAGFLASMASEPEFYLFDQSFAELARQHYRDLHPFHHRHGDNDLFVTSIVKGFIDRVTHDLAEAEIDIDQVQGEGGTGQLELNMAPKPPLAAADAHAVFKHILKLRALLDDKALTFMAKPFTTEAGSGGHVHLCLAKPGAGPLLVPGERPDGDVAAFMAGVLAHSADFMILHAPYGNSYRRLVPGTFTPLAASWGWENRSCLLRLTGSGAGARFEFRLPGADANPYLVYAGLIGAGLAGLEAGLELSEETLGDAALQPLSELPREPHEALARFAGSRVVEAAFGPLVQAHLSELFAAELEAERRQVTDQDLVRCFEVV